MLVAVIVTFVIFNKSSEDELEDVSEEVVSEQVSEELSDEKSNKVSVTIYSPNEDADGFVTSKATVDKVKPSNLLNEMVKKDPSLKGVRSLGFVQNKD